ncbi:MAG TPA: CaiB/BaiF CoA-transferase family protein [bacterium]|nr:CaiB/BaiF CoA-transferase family protein [bacterium]
MQPLQGIKVLDLSRLAPGPFCTMVLADLGADVLLVEAPPGATSQIPMQRYGTAARGQRLDPLRRNKRSLVLNLKDPRGQEIFKRLVPQADVVVEGFRPGVLKRLGADYAALSEINPRIILCSVTGYGQTGPSADQVGHDINYISLAGLLGCIGWPGAPPAIPMNVVADFAGGGLHAALGVLAALVARGTTGRGQHVDIAMTDGVLYLLASAISLVLAGQAPPKPGQTMVSGLVPQYNVYQTADGGWISVGSLETKFWENLCQVMECPQWAGKPFDPATWPQAKAHFQARFKTKTRAEWMEILTRVEICAAPVYDLGEALADPHNVARHMVTSLEDPRLGTVRQVGVGPKFSDTPGAVRRLGPLEGEHTQAVLTGLGYAPAEIEALKAAGVVG